MIYVVPAVLRKQIINAMNTQHSVPCPLWMLCVIMRKQHKPFEGRFVTLLDVSALGN